MKRFKHTVNIMYPLTPHHITVHRSASIMDRSDDIAPLYEWCMSTFGTDGQWAQRQRVFMFANKAMATLFKLTHA